jgi:hygromycin-B 7''-O-kinase
MGHPAPPSLPRSAAQEILGALIPGFRVTGVVPRNGGEVNAVFEVRGDSGTPPLIIKIYPERWQSTSERWRSKLAKEVYVYRLLADRGIRQIPRVLWHAAAGVPALPSAFAVMTLLEGRPLSAVGDLIAESHLEHVYHSMGRLLAEVHGITADRWGYMATGIVDAKPSNTAYMLDQFATKLSRFGELGGGSALAGAINRHVTRHADIFAGCRQPTLCHNDFHDGNVLVRETENGWQVTGFIDVENTVVADPMLDLAKTDYYALRHDDTRRRAFLRGYGRLPPDGSARMTLYRLHHALEFWNWSASTGKQALLGTIRTDLEKIIDGGVTP